MQARFLLPVLWLLMLLLLAARLRAQGRPLGPWRLTYQMEQRWWQDPDTTKEPVQKWVPKWSYHEVKWDIEPDSIRLFLNCENPLIAPREPRKGQLPIRFTAAGATVRLDAKRYRLLIVPSAAVVTLWAHRGNILVFKHQFQAISPPLPKVEIGFSDPKHANWERPPPDSILSRFTLTVRAIPTEAFATILPDDARYRVPYFQFALLRGNAAIGKNRTVNGREINIPRDSLQIGDKFRVVIRQAQRMNFRGAIETIPIQDTMTYLKKEFQLRLISE